MNFSANTGVVDRHAANSSKRVAGSVARRSSSSMLRPGLLCTTLALIAIAGCDFGIARRVILWSPDGRLGVFLSQDGAYITDAHGTLSLLYEVGDDRSSRWPAAWSPDSQRLLILDAIETQDWAAVTRVVGPDRARQLARLGDQLGQALAGDTRQWDRWNAESGSTLSRQEKVLLRLYVQEHFDDQARTRLDERWPDIKDEELGLTEITTCRVSKRGLYDERVVFRSLNPVCAPLGLFPPPVRVSPDGLYVAVLEILEFEEDRFTASLKLVAMTPNASPREVATGAIVDFDWTPDGQNLVYVEADNASARHDDRMHLDAVKVRVVRSGDGELAKPFDTPAHTVAWVPAALLTKMWFSADRFLFTSAEATMKLPMTPLAFEQAAQHTPVSLFGFGLEGSDRDIQQIATVIPRSDDLSEKTINALMASLSVSPDGKFMAFATDTNLHVRPLDGRMGPPMTSPAAFKPDVYLPTWRGSDELCFLVEAGSPYGSPERQEMVLWSPVTNQVRCISTDWPDALVGESSENDSF